MIQIILNKKQVEDSLKLEIDPKIKKIIEKKPAIREGKWIYLVVPGTKLKDIKNL